MSKYFLTDGNGNYVKQNEFTAKFSTTSNIELATSYESYAKAKHILKNLPFGKNKKSFRVEERIDYFEEEKKEEPKLKPSSNQSIHMDEIKKLGEEPVGESFLEETSQTLKSFADFISQKRSLQNSLSEEMGKVEREIIDIEHYIEFNNLNAYQGWLAFKLLQQRLRRRRVIKDNIQALGYIECGHVNTDELRHGASCIDGLSGRRYKPRELGGLFK